MEKVKKGRMILLSKTEHVAIDLGYGFVKGISSKGKRILFPSIVGTGFDGALNIDEMFGTGGKNDLSNILVNYQSEDYFVGELAKESRAPSRIYDQERFRHEYTRILMNVAIQLLTEGRTDNVNVTTGLPLSFYSSQAKEFQQTLIGEQPSVRWKSGSLLGETFNSNINNALILPQGASAIYAAILNSEGKFAYPHLMDEGIRVGLIDIGYRTTDFVVVEMRDDKGGFDPVISLTDTIDEGVSNLDLEIEQRFKDKTGGTEMNENQRTRILRGVNVSHKGKRFDFTEDVLNSKKSISTNIADRLKSFWGKQSDGFDAIFLAGGGGKEFEEFLQPHFDNRLDLIKENQFANSIGYLRFGKGYFQNKE